jgi:hypothetical protein
MFVMASASASTAFGDNDTSAGGEQSGNSQHE